MYTITFYSFKGGVGRTLALVNVAAQLARMGKKVLLVDFDLEAPGLETFEHLRPPQPHPGIVEYVTEYLRSKQSPNVRDYIYSPPPDRKLVGQLWVMPAGRRDAKYQAALERLNWKKLYDDCEGFLFFEDTKAQWEQELKPDYVLIDSRTGHTDVKGICTRQLPDAVVLLFFPNEQNRVGLKAVCQEIRSEREHGLKKTIGLHFVMSDVPDLDDEDKVLRRHLKDFEKELGIRKLSAVIHRYESMTLLDQPIFVLDRPRSRLAREYRKLTRELIRYNPADREGALQFLRRYEDEEDGERLWEEDEERAVGQGLPKGEELRNKILANSFDRDPDVLFKMAGCPQPDRGDAERRKLLDQVLALKPDHPEALFHRGTVVDLFQYLRNQGLESSHGFSALYRLRDEAPKRLAEAVDCAIARGIVTESKYRLAQFLAETDAGLPGAIRFMQDYLADENNTERKADATFFLQSYLIRARRCREVVSAYDTDKADAVGEASSWAELFNVGMAHWALSGTVPPGIRRKFIPPLGQNEALHALGEYGPLLCGPEADCWVFWWSGSQEIALNHLGNWIELIEIWMKGRDGIRHWPWWSFWRYRGVQLSEYRDDCEQLRRMIQGEPIRPPFLADSAEATEVPDTLGSTNSGQSA